MPTFDLATFVQGVKGSQTSVADNRSEAANGEFREDCRAAGQYRATSKPFSNRTGVEERLPWRVFTELYDGEGKGTSWIMDKMRWHLNATVRKRGTTNSVV